ncbi:MAG: response regulator transcription factor [Solirubrobacteraceae bacterium]
MKPTEATILVVEENRTRRTFLKDNLAADGYEILEAANPADALCALETKYPDLALIDLGLPDRAGLELCSAVRSADGTMARTDPDLPLLLLSDDGDEMDLLRAFQRGADDVVTAPFSYQELRARIGALLRRTSRRPAARRIRVGTLELDPLARLAWVEGKTVRLSNKEFGLLRVLAEEPTRAFRREDLLRTVWGFQSDTTATRTLDTHAGRLRRKLEIGEMRFVINAWGIGYRLVDGGA